MGPIQTFFSDIDAAVQRRFDAACFFLMRRFGVRKSAIRYFLNGIYVTGTTGVAVHLARIGYVGLGVIAALYPLLLLIAQHVDRHHDHEAETRMDGTASEADRTTLVSGRNKLMAAANIVVCVCLIRLLPEHALGFMAWLMTAVSHLLLAFLARTPMNPPAERERESILTPQTAPAKS